MEETRLNQGSSQPDDLSDWRNKDGHHNETNSSQPSLAGDEKGTPKIEKTDQPVESEEMAKERNEPSTNEDSMITSEVKNNEAFTGTGVSREDAKITTQTITSDAQFDVDSCPIGSVSMYRIRKIITNGTTTLELVPREEPKWEESKKEEPTAKTLGKTQYNITPLYVKELRDIRSDDLVSRKTSSLPFITDKSPRKHSHVIEIVIVRAARITKYDDESLKQEFFDYGTITTRGIRIISPLLRHALASVVKYYPGYNNLVKTSSCIEPPYRVIAHHRKELEKLKLVPLETFEESLREEITERNKHIDCLLEFVRGDVGDDYSAEYARHQQNPPVATFEYFWTLLKPGNMVYRKVNGIWSCWVVGSLEGGLVDGRTLPYEVKVWNICFDGQEFGRYFETHIIQPWEGGFPIRAMELYPADIHDDSLVGDGPAIREKLIERGKKYVKLAHQSHCDYHGQCLTHPKRTYNSAVMIDTAMQRWEDSSLHSWKPSLNVGIEQVVAGCTCSACLERVEFQEKGAYLFASCDKLNINSRFTDEQYLICSYWVFGYILSARKWEILSVDGLQDHEDNSDYIDKLVIDPENMLMIKAICRTYARDRTNLTNPSWSADMIRGKGDGQIFLLHGKPGVGKTLTAECVAEYTRRPLLPLTPGDIGTDPVTVDKTLAKYFKLGESWGAIILLDEADVYLEARNFNDLERNSLVSVFLRAMEYYQGILFLTTNRVGSFDEAFASRIHIHLYYSDLESDDRNKICDNLVEKLEMDRQDVSIESRAIDYLKENENIRKIGWNGRQIRNAFQTAVSLAEYDASEEALKPQPCKFCKKTGHPAENCWVKFSAKKGKKIFVKQKHMEAVYNMSNRFKNYLNKTRGDDSKLAKINKLREEDFQRDAVMTYN